MSIRLACNVGSYGPYRNIAFEHLASIGCRNVEFHLPADDQLDALEADLEKHGLTATTVMSDFPIHDEGILSSFHRSIHAANRFGAGVIFVSAHSKEVPLDVIYDRLRKLGDEAADHGVKIGIETHPDLADNGRVARQTMEAVNHPAVGINFDTANVLFYADGPSDTIEELKKVLPWVVSVHLKDYSGTGPKQWAVPTLGKGHIDFPAVFRLLEAQGFDGPATLEIEGVEGETLTEAQMKERVADSVRAAQTAMG